MLPVRRIRQVVPAVLATVALGVAPAGAFDSGPHTDMTRDAFTAEGFGANAADVGVVDNWFVDYYWNASANPFSGHSDILTEVAAGADIIDVEFWPQDIVDGTNHMHFDSSQPGFPEAGAAGPFSVSATSYPAMNSQGLAAGASQTFQSGHGCIGGMYHAVVDPADQVKEANETNNTADIDVIC